jgi:hypothetical protein
MIDWCGVVWCIQCSQCSAILLACMIDYLPSGVGVGAMVLCVYWIYLFRLNLSIINWNSSLPLQNPD